MVNGEGIRCTLYVSGCSRACPGCFNRETWNYNSGWEYTSEVENVIMTTLHKEPISGLSVLGGNPTERRNIRTIVNLCKRVKTELPTKTVYLWSGHTKQEIECLPFGTELLNYVDVLIDGKFEKEYYVPNLELRGSTNQIIYTKIDNIWKQI